MFKQSYGILAKQQCHKRREGGRKRYAKCKVIVERSLNREIERERENLLEFEEKFSFSHCMKQLLKIHFGHSKAV